VSSRSQYHPLLGSGFIISPSTLLMQVACTKSLPAQGLIFATVSSLGAVMHDWKSLKSKRDEGNDERSSDYKPEQVAEV
jgi:hypothetical protein